MLHTLVSYVQIQEKARLTLKTETEFKMKLFRRKCGVAEVHCEPSKQLFGPYCSIYAIQSMSLQNTAIVSTQWINKAIARPKNYDVAQTSEESRS
jgi:hypothetical protein